MKKQLYFICNLLFFTIFITFSVFGKDYTIEDNGEIDIIISKENINRLKIFNDRIKDIRVNSEELRIDIDKISGEIYIKPLIDKNIDVFIKTENNFTYKFLMKVKNLPAQQIFINRDSFTLQNYANSDIIRREKLKLINENLYFDFDENYKLSSINLIRLMSINEKYKDFNIISRGYQNLLNYDNFKVEWIYSYIKNDKSGITGEVALITNRTDQKLILTEDIFIRKGIRAVSLEKLELLPNESCFLYFIGGNE